MKKSKVLEINKENFKFEEFINEIQNNFKYTIDSEYVCVKMRPSNIEEYVYVEEEESEHDIFYIRFIIDKCLLEDEGYICGDGSELSAEDVDYGDFINYDNGFIILENDNILSIHKATYGPANPVQYVVRLVDNGGSFEELIQNFVNKFVK